MVGNGLTLGKDLLQRGAPGPQGGKLFVAGEGVVAQGLQLVALEHAQHQGTDHPRPQNAHFYVVIAGKGMGVRGESFPAAPLHPACSLEESLSRKDDLSHGEFRHRHRVGRPGAEYLDPSVEEWAGEFLDGPGGVKHRLQPGKVVPDLLFRQGGHAPGGKQVIRLAESLAVAFRLVPQHLFPGKLQGLAQPPVGLLVIGGEKVVLPGRVDE